MRAGCCSHFERRRDVHRDGLLQGRRGQRLRLARLLPQPRPRVRQRLHPGPGRTPSRQPAGQGSRETRRRESRFLVESPVTVGESPAPVGESPNELANLPPICHNPYTGLGECLQTEPRPAPAISFFRCGPQLIAHTRIAIPNNRITAQDDCFNLVLIAQVQF